MNSISLFISHLLGSFLPLIAGIFGVSFLIIIHELGHFLFAKIFGIRTPSFAIGFGPLITSKKIGQTEFMLRAFPLGGYVELAGATQGDHEGSSTATNPASDSFIVKPYYQKLAVMVGGIAFNLAFAYITFIALLSTGLPKTPLLYPLNALPIIQTIESGSAAEKQGIQPGDRILTINNQHVGDDVEILIDNIHQSANRSVPITFERNGATQSAQITVGERIIMGQSVGSLGIVFVINSLQSASFFDSIKQGVKLTNSFIVKTLQGFALIASKRSIKSMAGPISIISMTMQGALQGLKVLLVLLSIISINLAILNLVPLPIFDGGQIFLFSIEALAGRSIPERIREYIAITSWLLVLGLVFYLSAHDIARIASPHVETIKQFLGFASK